MPVVDYAKAIPVVGADGRAPNPVTAPISAYRYLDGKREIIEQEARTRPLIRIWDHRMSYIGTVAGEKSVSVEELLHDTGTGEVVIRADDWLIDFLRRDVRKDNDLHITVDPNPNRRNWRTRWGGKITNVRVKRDEDGTRSVVLECAHNREHWKHLYFGATPFMDVSVQPIKAWLLPANTRTAITITAFINLARNFWPALALPTQALNPGAWIGEASNLLNLNPLNWPVQVAFVNPFTDQSRFSVIMSRWSDAHNVTEAMLRDSGCHVRAYTWLPEDEDSPHPELASIVGQDAARPTRACVVLACEDASGITGPTGSLIDGALNLLGAVADGVIETVYNLDADGDGVTDPLIRKMLRVAPKVPDIAFRDTEHSQIINSEHSMYRTKASKILTGGKSPGWVNQAQTFAIKYALSKLSEVIQSMIAPAEVSGVQQPGSPGIEELYQGQFDNTLLAYMQITDPVRANRAGPYGYLEHFEQGSGSAWTISSALTLREGHYKTRPYQAFKVSIRNGGQYTLYYDFDLGTRCHFEIDGILHTDQVTAIKLHYDQSTPKTFDISIGDDRESENPMAAATRSLANLWNAVGLLFGNGDMF